MAETERRRPWAIMTLVIGLFLGGVVGAVLPIALWHPEKPPWWWVITATLGTVAMFGALAIAALAMIRETRP